MLSSITHTLQTIWLSWAGLFAGIPNGDPYVAFVALFALLCLAIGVVQKIKWRIRYTRNPELQDDRFKTWCKVNNLSGSEGRELFRGPDSGGA